MGLAIDPNDAQAAKNTLDGLVSRANEVAGILINKGFGDGSKLQGIIDSLNDKLADWGDQAQVSSAKSSSDFSPEEQAKFDQAEPLFNQLKTYLNAAGIDGSGSFIETQRQQVNWLYLDPDARADTAGMIGTIGNLGIKAAIISLIMHQQLQLLANNNVCYSTASAMAESPGNPLPPLPSGIDDICPADSGRFTFTFTGTVTPPNGHDQTVDAAVTVPAFNPPLTSPLNLDFTLAGSNGSGQATISNPTVKGALSADLEVDISSVDAQSPDLINLLNRVVTCLSNSNDPACNSNDAIDPKQALLNTNIQIGLNDLSGSLTRESIPASNDPDDTIVQQGDAFQVAADGDLTVNMAAVKVDTSSGIPQFSLVPGKQLLTGTLHRGHFIAPRVVNGQQNDYLKTLDSAFCNYLGKQRQPLNVIIADTSTAEGCFAARLAEIPELQVVFQGHLDGAVNVVNQVISGFLGDAALSDMIDGLDLSGLQLGGTAKLKVLDPQGPKTFTFDLDNNRVTAKQVGTDNQISIYLASLNGGYLVHDGVWVGSFQIDWANLGVHVQLADGTQDTFALGSIFGAIQPELIQVIIDGFGQINLAGLGTP